jgi:hypothetical protein
MGCLQPGTRLPIYGFIFLVASRISPRRARRAVVGSWSTPRCRLHGTGRRRRAERPVREPAGLFGLKVPAYHHARNHDADVQVVVRAATAPTAWRSTATGTTGPCSRP